MIIISGASRGIGAYLMNEFSDASSRIVGLYNNTKPESIEGEFYKSDIRDYDGLSRTLLPLLLNEEDLVLINCAGITYSSFTHKSDPAAWKGVIETNLIGTYNAIRCVLPKMRENNYGRIINFSSVVAEVGTPGVSAYAATKSALWGMSKSIAIENASKGITINSINMGYSELGMIKEVPSNYLDKMIDQIPLKRLCTSEEIVDLVKYLIGADYMTGEVIRLNGGLT
jgi:NAD(P)-dependent dehydrogenase (short-subunit alcohol dehydrogenase family)